MRVVVEFEGDRARVAIPVERASDIPAVVARLVAEGARIMRVTPDQRSLEEAYLDLVGEN
jgi:hypothetical protein